MRRTKAEAEETREQIFRAGVKVFAEKGYAATRMTDVAKEAGCTRGAIYWHFKNKEAFFVETINRLERFYEELVNSADLTGADAVSAITSAVKSAFTRFAEDPEFRAMQELVMRNGLGHGDVFFSGAPHPADHNEEVVLGLLGTAIARGQLYDGWSAETARRAITGFVSGIFIMIVDRETPFDEHEIDELAAFLGRGLAPIVTPQSNKHTDRPDRSLPHEASPESALSSQGEHT